VKVKVKSSIIRAALKKEGEAETLQGQLGGSLSLNWTRKYDNTAYKWPSYLSTVLAEIHTYTNIIDNNPLLEIT
jgi:hypothetical protein